MTSPTVNALNRWSCIDNELPSAESIKQLHVYDFDNTLFTSPLPNKQIWQGMSVGALQSQETFFTGGWWHDSNILKATGEGMEKEEARGWAGWWNEKIVELVELSIQQRDALTVLLTGRSERGGFGDIIERMVKSRKLRFDMIVLRPEAGPLGQMFKTTMNFKQVFLGDLIKTYTGADQIKVYEDRPKHVQQFQDFLNVTEQGFRKSAETALKTGVPPARKPIHGEVIEVSGNAMSLDPLIEVMEVQRMINAHNTAYASGQVPRNSKPYEIKRSVLYTGYLLKPEDTKRLLEVSRLPSRNLASGIEGDYRTLANNVLITPRPCPKHILDRVGGLGHKFRWRAVKVGSFDNKIWAAQVQPVTPTQPYYTECNVPMITLATRGTGKPIDANRIQEWSQLSQTDSFEFETEVGEKVMMRIEEERAHANQHSNAQRNPAPHGLKRTRPFDDDFPALGAPSRGGRAQQPGGNQGQPRGYHNDENRRPFGQSRGRGSGPKQDGGRNPRGGKEGGGQSRGGRGGHQRGRGGAAESGRGRGGRPPYRSLDDEVARGGGAGGGFSVDGADDRGLTY